jgi:endonuclease/exonuclease/phosphatase family metal-dependent hydrolase
MLAREGISSTNVARRPSDRDIAAMYHGIFMHPLRRRNEGETFYNGDFTYLLPASPSEMILADDFNCVLSNTECTGQHNCSTALDGVVRVFKLTDVWRETQSRRIYTYCTPTGDSRIDRIYVTKNLNMRKRAWKQ